jgi:hypothetical protein
LSGLLQVIIDNSGYFLSLVLVAVADDGRQFGRIDCRLIEIVYVNLVEVSNILLCLSQLLELINERLPMRLSDVLEMRSNEIEQVQVAFQDQ